MIVIGIDENGLAPLLGPLVVTATVFSFADQEYCLWGKYKETVSKHLKDKDKKVIVNDSKIIFNSQQPKKSLQILKKSVSAFLSNSPPTPEFVTKQTCSLPPLKFNREIKKYSSKNMLDLAYFFKLITALVEQYPTNKYKIYCGKVGATKKYIPKIESLELFKNNFWSRAELKIVNENKKQSRYLIRLEGKKIDLMFSKNSDSKHFPVALSSIFGKYVREMYMGQFNKLFRQHEPTLPRTSGYPNKYTYEFIKKSKGLRKKLGMEDTAVIRNK